MLIINLNGDVFSYNSKGVWNLDEGTSSKWKGKEGKDISFSEYRALYDSAFQVGFTPEDFRKIRSIPEDAKVVPSIRKSRAPSENKEEKITFKVKQKVKPGFVRLFV